MVQLLLRAVRLEQVQAATISCKRVDDGFAETQLHQASQAGTRLKQGVKDVAPVVDNPGTGIGPQGSPYFRDIFCAKLGKSNDCEQCVMVCHSM